MIPSGKYSEGIDSAIPPHAILLLSRIYRPNRGKCTYWGVALDQSVNIY